jgi:uncharacterized protein YqcC (DUF446 family)
MTSAAVITDKVREIRDEMKQAGLWLKQQPAWVNDYAETKINTGQNFACWLQFVYLPNLLQWENRGAGGVKNYIVPQAMRFFSADVKRGKLLQLLIELDSLL